MPKRSKLATPQPRSGGAASPERATVSRAAVETRVFRSGNSDAVRIPKGFGLSDKTVKLRRLAGNRVLIEPKRKRRWPAGFLSSFGQATSDFEPDRLAPASPEEDARAARRFSGNGA